MYIPTADWTYIPPYKTTFIPSSEDDMYKVVVRPYIFPNPNQPWKWPDDEPWKKREKDKYVREVEKSNKIEGRWNSCDFSYSIVIPGADPKDIQVNINNGKLNIRCSKYYVTTPGVITGPTIDICTPIPEKYENPKVTYKKGVLKVKFSKVATSPPQNLEIVEE